MPYDYITLAQARTAVAKRLGDPSMTFWLADEIDGLIRESLQIWQTATLYHRARASFNTVPGQAFYDISNVLSDGTELVLQRTLTAQQIVKRIQYHLTENAGDVVDGSVWVGTEMFTLDDLYQAVYRRVNRFLEETGQIITASQLTVTSGNGIVDIPTEWIDVRRAGWETLDGSGNPDKHNVLWRTSEYILDSQFNDWNVSPGRPEAYSIAVAPLIRLQLAPPPNDTGMLDLIMVNALTTTGALNIFNDFGWVIKWGAIADLLGQDGEASDPDRSSYAQQRWDEGIQLAKIMSTVLRTEINGQAVQPCALFDLDAGVPGWQDAVGAHTFATATITETVLNPIDGTVISLGSEVFVWVNAVVNPTDVLIGATIAESFQNMVNVINLTSVTAQCTATLNGSTLTLTANAAGDPGNSITLSINDPAYGVLTPFGGGVALDNLATPTTPAFAGPNLVALYPVPNVTINVPDGRHSISVDCIRNAILPVADGDFLQIGREYLSVAVYDLTAHLASFKMQGQEFAATMSQYKRVFEAATEQNQRLKESSAEFPILAEQEEADRPRLLKNAA